MDAEVEDRHRAAIEQSIRDAERKLAMADIPDEETDPEAFWAEYEQIFHCEVCTVREVLDVIWPAVDSYIDWLRAQVVERGQS